MPSNQPQPIDGIDLTPVLKEGSKELRDHAYYAFPMGEYLGEAIRNDRYLREMGKKSFMRRKFYSFSSFFSSSSSCGILLNQVVTIFVIFLTFSGYLSAIFSISSGFFTML